MMKWKKLGRVFDAQGQMPWMQSHAAVPFAESLGGALFRIYFSTRDSFNCSHTASLVIDLNYPERILDLSSVPELSPGELGLFDDSGAMATWLTTFGDTRYLYYIGWNLGVTVPFRNAIGLAISESGEPFQRYAPGPILDRTAYEPHFCASCCVLRDEDKWSIWYLSCTGWDLPLSGPRHRYHIKYAESLDGIHFNRDGRIAIDYADETEFAISRPSVMRDQDGWKMWFSTRGEQYMIGYAESGDGKQWVRRDMQQGLGLSEAGWDSEMVEYPHVFDCEGARFMLYNGNGYGRTGFGLAVMA